MYERPEVLASFDDDELAHDAAVCTVYVPGGLPGSEA